MNLRPFRLALAVTTRRAAAACSPVSEEAPAAPEAAAPVPAAAAKAGPAIVNRWPAPAPRPPAAGQYKYINERGQVQVAARLEDIPRASARRPRSSSA
jgi:hypothetical protein